ncbi:MAG: hypothetical protein M3081_11035 [Gemmatimonadota bacterium]|nr:hypothetical protein [Gemmatimonadota bacterium]
MPQVPFSLLPEGARVWVFGSDAPVVGQQAERLLSATDDFLEQWAAHGAPLTCARAWRDDRFLVIAVDESNAGASGCSIDGLFRVLGGLESEIGASLRGSGKVFYRDASGVVASAPRAEFKRLAAAGEIGEDSIVFDTSVTSLADYTSRFESPAGRSWHAQLLPARRAI